MVKQGYKQTEIGVIPEGWEVLSVDNLVKTQVIDKPLDGNHGNIHPKSSDYVREGIPFIMASDVSSGRINFKSCYHISKKQSDSLQKGFSVEGDVLLTHKGTVGSTAIVPKLNTDYIMLTPQVTYYRVLNKNLLSNVYLKNILDSKPVQDQIQSIAGAGATRAYIGITQQRSLQIPLPPLAEQEAIAEALSDADAWIESLEQLIAKKRLIKQGAMQELLTPPSTSSGNADGEVLELWEVKKLGDYVKFQTGFPFSSDFFNTQMIGERLIKNRDLRSDDSIFYYSGEFKKEFIVNNGDLLIGMDGDFEPVLWKKGKALLNQRVGRVLKLKDISIEYLAYSLIDKLKEIEESTGSTTVKHLSHSDIENLEYKIPSLSDQERIATILSDMDAELEALEQKLSKARQIKQGMMQELLTGRVRLCAPMNKQPQDVVP